MNDSHPEPSTPDPYTDLSHVYANPNENEGQEEQSNLPDDPVDHTIAASVHKAGLT